MEDVEILDPLNDMHIYCHHRIFLPSIQKALDMYSAAPVLSEKKCHPHNFSLRDS